MVGGLSSDFLKYSQIYNLQDIFDKKLPNHRVLDVIERCGIITRYIFVNSTVVMKIENTDNYKEKEHVLGKD